MRSRSTKYYVELTMLSVILVILSFTPIGSIPLPIVKATTTHIPVIIGAIILGIEAGVFLGFLFGIVSVIRSTLFPTLTSFIFSPFIPLPGSSSGSPRALIVAFIPRIMIGIVVAALYKFLRSKHMKKTVSFTICGLTGSFINTLLVVIFIYILYAKEYAAVLNLSANALVSALISIICINGAGEAVVSAIIVPVICIPLLHQMK